MNSAKRHEQALTLLTEALKVQPDTQPLVIALGVTLGHLRRWPDAYDALSRARELGPTFPELECHLGEAELLSGHMREGVSRLQRVLAQTQVQGVATSEQPQAYRRAGFVLATFQKVAAGLRSRSTSTP
ncbi:MAG: tetratricopeptide repeat protein [bacterium]